VSGAGRVCGARGAAALAVAGLCAAWFVAVAADVDLKASIMLSVRGTRF